MSVFVNCDCFLSSSTDSLFIAFSAENPEFANTEPVPFRFTPAIQTFATAIGTEGVMTNAVFAIAQALLEKDNELEHMLSIFVREEVINWHHVHQKQPPDGALKYWTLKNIDAIVQRAHLLSCAPVREQVCPFSVRSFFRACELTSSHSFSNPLELCPRTRRSWSLWLRPRTQVVFPRWIQPVSVADYNSAQTASDLSALQCCLGYDVAVLVG